MISIIIPVLDEAYAVQCLLTQLQPLRSMELEIIVVDGGSEDDSCQQAEALCDQLIKVGRGRALQMNSGAAAASGEILWFLHADSNLPHDIQHVLQQFPSRQWGWFDVRLSGADGAFRLIERMMNLRARLTRVATGDQGVFIRRSLFDRVGGFPAIPLMEDVAISKQLRRLARPAPFRSALNTSSRRWEQQGVLRTVFLMWRLRLAYFLGVDPQRLAQRYYPG